MSVSTMNVVVAVASLYDVYHNQANTIAIALPITNTGAAESHSRYTTVTTATTPASDDSVKTKSESGDGEPLGYFFSIGDWGHSEGYAPPTNIPTDSVQKNVAKLMKDYVSKNGKPKFVINVGDSFYDQGVSMEGNNAQNTIHNLWKVQWRDIYGDDLTSADIPWFGVYGNHDYEGADNCCDHGKDDYSNCAQVKQTFNEDNGWVMPKTQYTKADLWVAPKQGKPPAEALDDLDLELVAMDTNIAAENLGHAKDFMPCIQGRMDESLDLFTKQMDVLNKLPASEKKGVIVFSHYPSWYGKMSEKVKIFDIMQKYSDANPGKITYFGGHTHYTGCGGAGGDKRLKSYECIVGGGGGWSCEGAQGVTVTKVYAGGVMKSETLLLDKCA